jgi:hypothetical protein
VEPRIPGLLAALLGPRCLSPGFPGGHVSPTRCRSGHEVNYFVTGSSHASAGTLGCEVVKCGQPIKGALQGPWLVRGFLCIAVDG